MADHYKVHEARRFPRIKASFLMKYTLTHAGQEESHLANVKDISGGGVKLWTDQKLEEGNLMKVSILIPSLERNVDAIARIIRVRKAFGGFIYYASLAFLEMSRKDQNVLNHFVETLLVDREPHKVKK